MASDPQGSWRLNQPVWIMDRIPGYFHHWRYDTVSRKMTAVAGIEGGRWCQIPAEWLTERSEE